MDLSPDRLGFRCAQPVPVGRDSYLDTSLSILENRPTKVSSCFESPDKSGCIIIGSIYQMLTEPSMLSLCQKVHWDGDGDSPQQYNSMSLVVNWQVTSETEFSRKNSVSTAPTKMAWIRLSKPSGLHSGRYGNPPLWKHRHSNYFCDFASFFQSHRRIVPYPSPLATVLPSGAKATPSIPE